MKLGLFHWGSTIGDCEKLAAFLDEHAAALARDSVQDYARARVRPGADAALSDPGLLAALERARWEAYPIVLTMIGEMIEGVLAPHGNDRLAQLQGLVAAMQRAFDRHPVPPPVGAPAWQAAREEAVRWLSYVSHHLPKSLDGIVETFAGPLLAIMPIHMQLGPDDYPLLLGALRSKLAEIRGRFEQEANVPALARALGGKE